MKKLIEDLQNSRGWSRDLDIKIHYALGGSRSGNVWIRPFESLIHHSGPADYTRDLNEAFNIMNDVMATPYPTFQRMVRENVWRVDANDFRGEHTELCYAILICVMKFLDDEN